MASREKGKPEGDDGDAIARVQPGDRPLTLLIQVPANGVVGPQIQDIGLQRWIAFLAYPRCWAERHVRRVVLYIRHTWDEPLIVTICCPKTMSSCSYRLSVNKVT